MNIMIVDNHKAKIEYDPDIERTAQWSSIRIPQGLGAGASL